MAKIHIKKRFFVFLMNRLLISVVLLVLTVNSFKFPENIPISRRLEEENPKRPWDDLDPTELRIPKQFHEGTGLEKVKTLGSGITVEMLQESLNANLKLHQEHSDDELVAMYMDKLQVREEEKEEFERLRKELAKIHDDINNGILTKEEGDAKIKPIVDRLHEISLNRVNEASAATV